ncbi:hypothetical protein L208DRAFT_1222691, partial [Tricholoma matsutake]
ITKIVNSLSAKMEMGAPMICMYLLGFPDHYTSHIFVPFYWQSFVSNARSLDMAGAKHETEHVTLFKKGDQIVAMSPVSDYIFWPAELESISLYDWISCSKHLKKAK